VSFLVEDSKVITAPFDESEVVHLDGGREGRVHSTEIHHSLSIDIDPDVIVTSEIEDFSSLVLKQTDYSQGIVIVVSAVASCVGVIVTETHAVQPKEGGKYTLVNTVAEWFGRGVTARVHLGEVDIHGIVHAVHGFCAIGPLVVVPQVHRIRARDGGVVACAIEDGESVRAEVHANDVFIFSVVSLKVGVALVALQGAIEGSGCILSTETRIAAGPEVSELTTDAHNARRGSILLCADSTEADES